MVRCGSASRNTSHRTGKSSRFDRHPCPTLPELPVRRIGFAPQEQANLRVGLGQNVIVDFALVPQATQLAGVTVTSTRENAILSPSHKGVSTVISDSSITRLPTLNRNFTDFVALTPQISTKGPGSSGGKPFLPSRPPIDLTTPSPGSPASRSSDSGPWGPQGGSRS